jgi:hypothetical protein
MDSAYESIQSRFVAALRRLADIRKTLHSASSPPLLVTQAPQPPSKVKSLNYLLSRRARHYSRKSRPSQGDWVLIRNMNPNQIEFAQQVSDQALNSDSGSESESELELEHANAPGALLPCVNPGEVEERPNPVIFAHLHGSEPRPEVLQWSDPPSDSVSIHGNSFDITTASSVRGLELDRPHFRGRHSFASTLGNVSVTSTSSFLDPVSPSLSEQMLVQNHAHDLFAFEVSTHCTQFGSDDTDDTDDTPATLGLLSSSSDSTSSSSAPTSHHHSSTPLDPIDPFVCTECSDTFSTLGKLR